MERQENSTRAKHNTIAAAISYQLPEGYQQDRRKDGQPYEGE